MKFIRFGQVILVLPAATGASAVPHMALMNFSTDDNSDRSARAVIDFITLDNS